MFNDLIDTASRRVCDACEKTRRLEGMVTRAASISDGAERSARNVTRLADTYGRRESGAVGDVQAAEDALSKAGGLLVSGALGADVARAARSMGTIAANVDRMSRLADRIAQGAGSIASGDIQSAMSGVGGRIGSAVGSVAKTFGRVQKAFTAALNPKAPSMLPANIELTALSQKDIAGSFSSGLSSASTSSAHLLILTSRIGESFYFNLSTAGYDTLRRQTSYNIAAQDRLTRRPALQAVSKGGESITVSGAIFTLKAGAGQLDKLRAIGFKMDPVMLTTGYGDALGEWYLTRIEEEQSAMFSDGMPRKQQFTLEFQRYGEDYSDI